MNYLERTIRAAREREREIGHNTSDFLPTETPTDRLLPWIPSGNQEGVESSQRRNGYRNCRARRYCSQAHFGAASRYALRFDVKGDRQRAQISPCNLDVSRLCAKRQGLVVRLRKIRGRGRGQRWREEERREKVAVARRERNLSLR